MNRMTLKMILLLCAMLVVFAAAAYAAARAGIPLRRVVARPVTREELARVHRADYLAVLADFAPDLWREWIARGMAANRRGAWLVPQVAGKPTSLRLPSAWTAVCGTRLAST